MKNFWNIVNKVIHNSDVLLLLLDARLVEETRNKEIEDKVKKSNKPLIYVITKCDLVDKNILMKLKKQIKPCVFVSAKEFLGTTILREKILVESKKAYKEKEVITVGVLGYPNVGKSSLINALKGRHSAPTSSMSGFTKGVHRIKADNRIYFLDTPGVIPYKEKDPIKHTIIGTIDFNKSKDPDLAVMGLMEKYPGKIESFFGIDVIEDKEEEIEMIARKRNILKKGGVPDIMRMARMILREWQKGAIK
jgi:ribosome biogenesis GTPase A